MGRLTDKNFESKPLHDLCGANNDCVIDCEDCFVIKLYRKLAHYEDLEEQGRLIEQKHGKWIKRRNKSSWTHFTYSCSVCDSGSDFDTVYCPNCGAKMDEVENE